MLTDERIESNKEAFIEILRQVKRPGAKIEELITKLESTDFFEAPASSRYHCAFKGGLVQHSLNVYNNLHNLVISKGCTDIISYESIVITALLHDMSKMNLYRTSIRNRKVYSPTGSKRDEMGAFDWVAEKSYENVPMDERDFLLGSHEETSEFMVSKYIPLTVEESVAILHHMGGKGTDSSQVNITPIYNRYPLACLLHVADMISTYVDEVI